MLQSYFKSLYQRTMSEAYALAAREIVSALKENGAACLDCGANSGYWFDRLATEIGLTHTQYHGIEWDSDSVNAARLKQLNVQQGDLNKKLPFENDKFSCVFALSVLEHLLNGCHFLKETHRTLKPGGKLVLLTPNISTYFTAALILAGKMPSSGPHPDSDILLKSEEVFKVSADELHWDTESDTPVHRHLVVFSYLTLKKYLNTSRLVKNPSIFPLTHDVSDFFELKSVMTSSFKRFAPVSRAFYSPEAVCGRFSGELHPRRVHSTPVSA